MGTYAAVLSLIHTIDQIQNHPRPPTTLDTRQVQSLTENLTFLQEFLEKYSVGDIKEFEGLEGRIVEAAYEAEDIIDSHIFDQIQAATANNEDDFSPLDAYHGLEKVMQDLDLIKKEVGNITKHIGVKLERNYSTRVDGPRPPSATPGVVIGLEDVLNEAMDKVIGQEKSRQIIPIAGMGGIGKTTLARKLYENSTIRQHFDVCGWATISQKHDSKAILLQVLTCLKIIDSFTDKSEHELGLELYQGLCGRRYLIVMDDIWSIEAWYEVKSFFPDNNNGSRMVITTRLLDLAFELSGSHGLEMGLLNEVNSWNLFRKCVFGEKECPLELEETAKKISRNCKGLPLSIVVIGGLLTRCNQTLEHWEYIAKNLNSVVNLDDKEYCLRILRLSYSHLPVHLKPCFLYMGLFPEDNWVSANELVKLWVAEGFLRPIRDKSLEETAEEYLKDLAQRALIIVRKLGRGPRENTEHISIHDLLRDLCIKEAEKDRFFHVASTDGPNTEHNWHTQRRIGFQELEQKASFCVRSGTLSRSLICSADKVAPTRHSPQLLRVFHRNDLRKYGHSLKYISSHVNLRHLEARISLTGPNWLPSSFYHLWNLQTLIVKFHNRNNYSSKIVIDLWRMPRLRHVSIDYLHLTDPPTSCDESSVLRDLQTLRTIDISKLSEDMVKGIPNIKDLELSLVDDCYLDNLGRLNKLEYLTLFFDSLKHHELAMRMVFPNSLRELRLFGSSLLWEELAPKVGHLPHLQVLTLVSACKGPKWETAEGQFQSLKVLHIISRNDLKQWIMADWTHFPCLEHLELSCPKLKAIPLEIGDIPTLKSIILKYCGQSAVILAKEIVKVQEDMGNEDLRVIVHLWGRKDPVVESLAAPNFEVRSSF